MRISEVQPRKPNKKRKVTSWFNRLTKQITFDERINLGNIGKAVEEGDDPHTMDRTDKDDPNNQPLYLPLYVFNRTMITI